MTSFVSGVAQSFVGGVVVILVAGALSKRLRWILTATFGRLLNIDIDYVYKSPRDAMQSIREELKRARQIDRLTGRGNELQRETFVDVLGKRPEGRQLRFRILLPDPEPIPSSANWIEHREKELAQFDRAFGNGMLPTQVRANIEHLRDFQKNGLAGLRQPLSSTMAPASLTHNGGEGAVILATKTPRWVFACN